MHSIIQSLSFIHSLIRLLLHYAPQKFLVQLHHYGFCIIVGFAYKFMHHVIKFITVP